jgi:hypothetical protein
MAAGDQPQHLELAGRQLLKFERRLPRSAPGELLAQPPGDEGANIEPPSAARIAATSWSSGASSSKNHSRRREAPVVKAG